MRFSDAPATYVIAGITILVFAILTLAGLEPRAALTAGFIPALVGMAVPPQLAGLLLPWWLTPLSTTLVHAGFLHLALNMVMLVLAGRQTERVLGWAGIAVLYLVGAYVAAAGQWALDPNAIDPMVGASGAISAIIAANATLFTQSRARRIGPLSPRIVHVLWLGAAWIGIQLLIGVAGAAGPTHIAIGAHIGGFIAGLLLARPLLMWRYRGA